jgi:hypothetical protein
MLRLNLNVPITAQPNRLGVLAGDLQGFPNGRRLTDDVVDIELQALVGAAQTGKLVDALATGDAVDNNDQQFGAEFPYVALPNGVPVNSAGQQAGTTGGTTAKPSGLTGGNGDLEAGSTPVSRETVPVAYMTGASGLAVLIVLASLFVFLRRRRGQAVTSAPRPYTDQDPTLRL